MIEFERLRLPGVLQGITSTTEDLELTMSGQLRFGALLRLLVASKPGGSILELGSGTGLLTAWLLDGMSADSRLLAVEADQEKAAVARRFHGRDSRLELREDSVPNVLQSLPGGYALIAAGSPKALPGRVRELAGLLEPGGILAVGGLQDGDEADDPEATTMEETMNQLEGARGLERTVLDWGSGVLLASRRAGKAAG